MQDKLCYNKVITVLVLAILLLPIALATNHTGLTEEQRQENNRLVNERFNISTSYNNQTTIPRDTITESGTSNSAFILFGFLVFAIFIFIIYIISGGLPEKI